MYRVILLLVLVSVILFSVWIWYHPESVLIPLNLLYNTDPSPRTTFYTEIDRNNIFPVGKELESIWKDIKHEGYNLYELLIDKNYNYLDNYNINIGDENKKDWTTIPLRLFGNDVPEYINRCPIIMKILASHPEIKSCLFSIMKPGKIIKPHVGPYDGLLRYQLALDIPACSKYVDEIHDICKLDECYLHVDGVKHHWIEGEGLMFDESNLHGAVNTTQKQRMVLLIDIERPYYLLPYRLLNKIVIWSIGCLSNTKIYI